MNQCRECDRDDLDLTANGRIRSHTADGQPRTEENPNCGGGSGLPRGVETEAAQPMRVTR